MGILSKLFGNKEKKNESGNDENQTTGLSFEISSNDNVGISVSSSPVGAPTDNTATDFYVYEWVIKETGEIFYVGKGRGSRYIDFHDRAYEAERIRETFDTDVRFVATDLTEEKAIELESQEMTRILNETNDRLTNRIIPLLTKRGNGYDRSPDTPALQFETASYLYPSEIEAHYFGKQPRPFDEVKFENLKSVVFIKRNMRDEINIIYGENLDKYLNETKSLLSMDGHKVLKSQYAKSVTAWIFVGDDYLTNYESDQNKALEKIGRNVPSYHLIDVWKLLKDEYRQIETLTSEEISINPVHSRVPLKDIKNLNDWSKGFDEGKPYWDKGDRERKDGNIKKAIELFDEARYNGYNAPALYKSYAMAYRKLKDYDNEIAVIDEVIARSEEEDDSKSYDKNVLEFTERKEKALELKRRQKVNK